MPLVDKIEEKDNFLFCDQIIHENPRFPEGQDSLMSFIYKNYQFPNKDLNDSGILVTVVGVFIDKNGDPYDVKIVRPVHEYLDQEALRLIKLIKKWVPALNHNGEAVKSLYYIPVRVHLE